MGIINITPDSFYKDSRDTTSKKIIEKIESFIQLKVDVIDVGAESSRPGAIKISKNEELNRLKPIFNFIKKYSEVKFSIDTYKSSIADVCLDNGFTIINDIYAGRKDKKMFNIVKKHNASIVLMHMNGNPINMQKNIFYNDLIVDINNFFSDRINEAIMQGLTKNNIIIDPGLGFGKSIKDNFKILDNLKLFKKHMVPILIGPSRKSFLSLNNDMPEDRLPATIAASLISFQNGADLIRVHDVKEIKQSLDFNQKILNYN